MATYLDETGLSTLWGKIKAKFLPLTGGTLTGSLTTNNGSNYTHLGVDRVISDKTHQFRVYPHASNNSIYLDYLIDGTSQTTLRICQGSLWTNGDMVYKLTGTDHYTSYYDTNNNHVATIRYNNNSAYHRFVFSHVDPTTGKYEAYVLPQRADSVDANTTYSILTSKTITASATELNYCDGVTSSIQTQLNGKVPTTRTINSKALSSNITLAASDVGAVPTTRTINSKALSSNISLTAADVGAVPTSRTVNSKALSSNITLTYSDVAAMQANPPYIEFAPNSSMGHGGYLDFHYNGSAEDYTSRIIEGSSGQLNINSMTVKNGAITATTGTFSGNIDIIKTGNSSTSIEVKNDGGSVALLVENNRGIWDYTKNGWAAYAGTDNAWHFNGNATSATKATQDGSGNTITSTYLKLSGGTLTGTLTSRTIQVRDGTNSTNYVQLQVNTAGTTSTNGVGRIVVGNSTASGTAGNAYGRISIYDSADKYYHLQTGTISSSKTKYLNKIPEVTWTSSTSTLAITV